MTILVAFGDSFIRGDDIDIEAPAGKDPNVFREQYCIVGQLATALGMTCENRGISGGSLISTMWQFARWAQSSDNKDVLVLIGLPCDSRHSFWKNPVQGSYWVNTQEYRFGPNGEHRDTDWGNLIKLFQSLSNGSDEWKTRYWLTANFFDSYCRQHQIPLMMFNVVTPTSWLELESIWQPTSDLNTELLTWTKKQSSFGDFINPSQHPTVKGATWCSQWLLEGLKQHKLI